MGTLQSVCEHIGSISPINRPAGLHYISGRAGGVGGIMKKLIIAVGLLLVACSTPQPGIEIRTVEVLKEVQRPCPVVKPKQPGKLARPLPADPARLIDLLLAKLTEWAGPGGYGERADTAIETCTKP